MTGTRPAAERQRNDVVPALRDGSSPLPRSVRSTMLSRHSVTGVCAPAAERHVNDVALAIGSSNPVKRFDGLQNLIFSGKEMRRESQVTIARRHNNILDGKRGRNLLRG